MKQVFGRKKNSMFNPAVILLVAVCVLLNTLLSGVVTATDLPFYIDTIGTITASALGGAVPGIITAFITNAVNFISDNEAIFYASLNMLIAILSATFFGEVSNYRKKLKKQNDNYIKDYGQKSLLDVVLFILILALVGGGFGAGITWYLYGTPSDKPMVVSISSWLGDRFGFGAFGCHMISTYITDIIDKTITVCVSILIIRLVPDKLKERVKMVFWRQEPIPYEEQKAARKKMKGNISSGTRINIIIIGSTLLMTVFAFVFSAGSFRKNTVKELSSSIEELSSSALQTAYLASLEIDPKKVDEYLSGGYNTLNYELTRQRLSNIKNESSGIVFLYVYKIEKDGCRVVFDLDATLENGTVVEGDKPGTVVDFEEALLPYKDELLEGRMLPAVPMEDEYGSFLAAYYPVYDKTGKCVCYAISNIESNLAGVMMASFFGRVLLLFAGFVILIITVSILTTKYYIVMPITSMTLHANEMTDLRGGANEDSLEKLEELDIRTNDEVEQLYKALCKLTGDTVYQLNDNRSKSDAITKMQNVLLVTMADMVESRDSDTGAHVLKTAAYVDIILQGLKRYGYYSEKLTDRYMRDVVMSAPLHDVGKINIPDAILNKPGKLTKEEFEVMKTHTTAGKALLESAISSMEGDNYLKEARNMAAYHHERWDGNGYPEGLHGEVIPLSARVMSIADVFDALSSPRVYKPAFPFEEAVNIIREGSGTQFDPKCVEVFIDSLAEVKKILKKYQEA
ncbi:MAG: HD domain-containing protein [Lachnospiraceae bacterium]|nr:HD domain-containing protein [Lachnospiraceae bacterium]